MVALANACCLRTTWSSRWTLTYAGGFLSQFIHLTLWNQKKQLYLLVDLPTTLHIAHKNWIHVNVEITTARANNLTAPFNHGNVFPFSCTLVLLCGILFLFFFLLFFFFLFFCFFFYLGYGICMFSSSFFFLLRIWYMHVFNECIVCLLENNSWSPQCAKGNVNWCKLKKVWEKKNGWTDRNLQAQDRVDGAAWYW